MRIAVLSDIHANRQAFEAVLAEVGSAGVDQVWCLGDVVGYGADPDACCELARANCDHSRTTTPARPVVREGWRKTNPSFSAAEASAFLTKGEAVRPKNEARKAIRREERRPMEAMRLPTWP